MEEGTSFKNGIFTGPGCANPLTLPDLFRGVKKSLIKAPLAFSPLKIILILTEVVY
jgi:hypothetical protein